MALPTGWKSPYYGSVTDPNGVQWNQLNTDGGGWMSQYGFARQDPWTLDMNAITSNNKPVYYSDTAGEGGGSTVPPGYTAPIPQSLEEASKMWTPLGWSPEQVQSGWTDMQKGDWTDFIDDNLVGLLGGGLLAGVGWPGFTGGGSTSGFGFGSPESLIGAESGGSFLDLPWGTNSLASSSSGFGYGSPESLIGTEGGGNMDLTDLFEGSLDEAWSADPSMYEGSVDELLNGSGSSAFTSLLKALGIGNEGGMTDGWLGKILAAAIPAGVGAYGASKQSDALSRMADQQDARWKEAVAMGAPYRSKLADLYANPASFLSSDQVQVPVQQGTDALARALSTKGNPFGNGRSLQELQNYSANQLYGRLGQEMDRLAGFGGLTAYNNQGAQGPDLSAAIGAMGADSNMWSALGRGFEGVLNPPTSIETLLRSLKNQGLI
jgi:hypothetical protein